MEQLRSNEHNIAVQYQQSISDAQRHAEMYLQQAWSSHAQTQRYEEIAAQLGQRAMSEILEKDKVIFKQNQLSQFFPKLISYNQRVKT